MNLFTSLRYVVALHEHKHFGRAAQACHISQPALSNALRALEEEFGTAIVKRGRVFEGFTPEGEQIFQAAQRIHRALRQELDLGGAFLGDGHVRPLSVKEFPPCGPGPARSDPDHAPAPRG